MLRVVVLAVASVLAGPAVAFDGFAGVIPGAVSAMATALRLGGYRAAAFDAWHDTPATEMTPIGPKHRWPARLVPGRHRIVVWPWIALPGGPEEVTVEQDGAERLRVPLGP